MTGIRSWTAEVTAFGRRSQNRTGLHPVATRVFPAIPDSRERKHLRVIDFKTVRLLGLPDSLPLVKSVCWDQAPARLQRIAERGLRPRGFRSCVNHPGSAGRVFRPRWNQSPTEQRQFPNRFLRILANDRNRLSGGNVVARIPVFLARRTGKMLLNNLLSPGKSIAPAHWEIMADRKSETRYQSSP